MAAEARITLVGYAEGYSHMAVITGALISQCDKCKLNGRRIKDGDGTAGCEPRGEDRRELSRTRVMKRGEWENMLKSVPCNPSVTIEDERF